MDNLDEIIVKLRQIVEERHQAGLKAIDDLVASLAGPALPGITGGGTGAAQNGSANSTSQRKPILSLDTRTTVEKVIDTIRQEPKTAKRIAAELGIPERKVRGVLYAKSVQKQIKSGKMNKKMHYAANEAASMLPWKISTT